MFTFCGDTTLYAMGAKNEHYWRSAFEQLLRKSSQFTCKSWIKCFPLCWQIMITQSILKKYTYIPNVNGQQINLIWPKKINFIIFYRFWFIFRRRKKRSQKTKFYEAYKFTMYSMANELKGLMWGIKWKAIKFCANCIEYRTFHQSLRFSSDPPTHC